MLAVLKLAYLAFGRLDTGKIEFWGFLKLGKLECIQTVYSAR
jgi:hypothetical protein